MRKPGTGHRRTVNPYERELLAAWAVAAAGWGCLLWWVLEGIA